MGEYVVLTVFDPQGNSVSCTLCFACYHQLKDELLSISAQLVESTPPAEEAEQP